MPRSLKGFSAFMDGVGYAGRLMDGQLPKVTLSTEKHRDGGMDGVREMDMGQEPMEITMAFAEYTPALMGAWGLLNGTAKRFTLRGSMESEDGDRVAIISTTEGLFKEVDPGNWSAGGGGGGGGSGGRAQLKLMQAPHYYRLEIGGSEIYEIDVPNVVRRVQGVDQLAARRQALGL